MLFSIGVKNLRSFKKTTKVNLNPITVFVGKNSSGKSSFLRTLPLFRQSIESNTTGPILWFGRYVDFGDFSEAVSNLSSDEPIEFYFNLQTDMSRPRTVRLKKRAPSNIEIKLSITSQKLKTIIKSISIKINDVLVTINPSTLNTSSAAITIEGEDGTITKNDLTFTKLGKFIPSLSSIKKKEDMSTKLTSELFFPEFYYYHHDDVEELFIEEAVKIVKSHSNARTDTRKIKESLSRIPISNKDEFLLLLMHVFKDQKIFTKHLTRKKEEIIRQLYPYLIGWNINYAISEINAVLHKTFSSIKYIAPLRATTERYYRFQDLQINEIDHTGSNLAMLLNSLRPNEQREFTSWTRDNFGFSVLVKEVGAHYAVTIRTTEENKEYNISDMGFGYSQMLPIIATIWLETEKRKTSSIRTAPIFVIEQPELHLHPAFQAKLGELFSKVVAAAKEKGVNLKIIFETHSQNIIESLGEAVEDPNININNHDISVIVFDKNADGETNISTAEFDESGYLMNWPIGFFSGK
ncbi:hypothetical protein CGX12_18630 [Zobellella denitrificans]|uniref:AAA family ATPase n=1 Tax=Zobellella denitrificans TaxID=347534 RepID=UPI000B8BC902|nr:AAA family ATPase [Zobellella denitrificans]OXS13640.1 hypothetical protein CGX12_18630 [Zobellella denitrificans]